MTVFIHCTTLLHNKVSSTHNCLYVHGWTILPEGSRILRFFDRFQDFRYINFKFSERFQKQSTRFQGVYILRYCYIITWHPMSYILLNLTRKYSCIVQLMLQSGGYKLNSLFSSFSIYQTI